MPSRLLASIIVLMLWPIQAGVIGIIDLWFEPVGMWTRVAVPLFIFASVSGLLWATCWLIYRYCDPAHPARLLHDRLAQWLSPRGYAWLPLPASCLAAGGASLTVYLSGWEHAVNVTSMLMVALGGIWDLTKPRAMRLETDLPPQPRMDCEPSESELEEGKSVTVRWSGDFDRDDSNTTHSVHLSIPEGEYESYRSRDRFEHRPLSNYGRYVSNGLSPSLHKLACEVRKFTTQHDLTSLDEALCVVSLARAIPYAKDDDTHRVSDWADYPVELLYEERGDCEDHAILAAALLHLLGHVVALYWIDFKETGHIALGYHAPFELGSLVMTDEHGIEFLYVETVPVSENYVLGDIPPEFLAELRDSQIISIPATA